MNSFQTLYPFHWNREIGIISKKAMVQGKYIWIFKVNPMFLCGFHVEY